MEDGAPDDSEVEIVVLAAAEESELYALLLSAELTNVEGSALELS